MRVRRAARSHLLPIVLLVHVASGAAAEPPAAAQILKEAGFPSDTEQKVLGGQMVKTTLESADERDLAVGLVFLVKLAPEELRKKLSVDALVNHVDPTTIAFGRLEGDASPAALAELSLGDDEAKLYRSAEKGSDLNLSAQEIESFQGLAGGDAVDEAVGRQLLERYRAYRSRGLAGIAPYQREHGTTNPAADLKSAIAASKVLERHEPEFYRLLDSYPEGKGAEVGEAFSWVHFTAHGDPTLVLVHALWTNDEDLVVVAQRQYYVNRGYNVEQAVAGFFPVKEGTLVIYANHTSTDQVAGFGGGAKRGIGERVMASQLETLFGQVRKAAEK